MTTQLYHAQVLRGGPSGVCFRIGESTLFAPVDEERLYLIDPAQLVVTSPVSDGMADFLAATVIEPRLERLGGVPC
jgi:hypothetical protein